jgi:hypothetical protein
MAYAKSGREFVKGNDCRIALPLFKATDVLLAKSQNIGKLFLRQTAFLSDSPDVSPDQFAHIHAQWSADYILEVYQL